MTVRWVGQEHPRGCGHAALAMLLGWTYPETVSAIPDPDPNVSGLSSREIDGFLAVQGYAVARRFRGGRWVPNPWPMEPFANVHLCHLTVHPDAPCDHWVVMLADGTVLDPLTPEPRRLSDYHQINNIAAVVPLRL